LEARQSHAIVKKYSNFEKLWGGVQFLAAKFIKQHQAGKVNPGKVNQIADAIDKAMKGTRLLNNESTENISTNWHMEIVNAVRDKESANDINLLGNRDSNNTSLSGDNSFSNQREDLPDK